MSEEKRLFLFSLFDSLDEYIIHALLRKSSLKLVSIIKYISYLSCDKFNIFETFLFYRTKSWRIIRRQGLSGRIRASSYRVWREVVLVATSARRRTHWMKHAASLYTFESNVSYSIILYLRQQRIFLRKGIICIFFCYRASQQNLLCKIVSAESPYWWRWISTFDKLIRFLLPADLRILIIHAHIGERVPARILTHPPHTPGITFSVNISRVLSAGYIFKPNSQVMAGCRHEKRRLWASQKKWFIAYLRIVQTHVRFSLLKNSPVHELRQRAILVGIVTDLNERNMKEFVRFFRGIHNLRYLKRKKTNFIKKISVERWLEKFLGLFENIFY